MPEMEIPVVKMQFKVLTYETDINWFLKPVFLQDHPQEAAYDGGDFCGAGYEKLKEQGLFWALNRMHIKVYSWPRRGDTIDLHTWSRAHEGPLWHRNFRLFRGSEVVVEATSAWTLIDMASRSIFRGESSFDESRHYGEDTLPFCSKIVIPKTLEFTEAGRREALYSDLDPNGHVNNCIYPGWAIDALPLDYVTSHELSDVQINYYREIHAGETADILTAMLPAAEGSGEVWLVQGLVNGAQSFTVRLEFIPKN